MRDTVTEIQIDNPVAREVFIRWWRMMEAQGYQYGYEALCNVWVGFDDGRTDLASKVLETTEAQRRPYEPNGSGEYNDAIHDILTALRDLFQKEGVNTVSNCNPADSDAELIRLLRQRRRYYDESIFQPSTIEEARAVHQVFPNAVDRISADAARHILDVLIGDIEAGEHRRKSD